jgi:hypothetical protein
MEHPRPPNSSDWAHPASSNRALRPMPPREAATGGPEGSPVEAFPGLCRRDSHYRLAASETAWKRLASGGVCGRAAMIGSNDQCADHQRKQKPNHENEPQQIGPLPAPIRDEISEGFTGHQHFVHDRRTRGRLGHRPPRRRHHKTAGGRPEFQRLPMKISTRRLATPGSLPVYPHPMRDHTACVRIETIHCYLQQYQLFRL